MAVFTTESYSNGASLPTTTHVGMEMAVRVSFKFTSAVTLGLGDVIRLGKLPANFALTNIVLDTDAMGTAAVASVGILNDAETAVESATHTAQSLATAGVIVGNQMAARRAAINTTKAKTIGVVLTTAASAALAQNAILGATIYYRSKQVIE